MRAIYRSRRAALLTAVAHELPEAGVHGIAAGLHAGVTLADHYDENDLARAARRHGIALATLTDYRPTSTGPPTLLLGYTQHPEPTIGAGIAALASAIQDSQPRAVRASPAARHRAMLSVDTRLGRVISVGGRRLVLVPLMGNARAVLAGFERPGLHWPTSDTTWAPHDVPPQRQRRCAGAAARPAACPGAAAPR